MEFHEIGANMKACFIGHRTINLTEQLKNSLETTIIHLIHNGVTTFLFGSKSEFDSLSWEIVTKIKEIYPHIKRIYIRSNYQYISKSYENYLVELYDETYFPKKLEKAGKYSYVERNCEMIDNSTYCIFYYSKEYIPQSKRNSGTKIAYEYAVKKKKEIINLYKQ